MCLENKWKLKNGRPNNQYFFLIFLTGTHKNSHDHTENTNLFYEFMRHNPRKYFLVRHDLLLSRLSNKMPFVDIFFIS